MMDAREKWLERGDALLVEAINSQYHLGQMSGGNCVTMQQAIPSELAFDAIRAHLRTTPEGFALVPVPEWVKFGERLPVVKAGETHSPIWITRQLEVPDESLQEVLGDYFYPRDIEWWNSFYKHGFTHWSYRYVEPAPKAPPPKSESL